MGVLDALDVFFLASEVSLMVKSVTQNGTPPKSNSATKRENRVSTGPG